MPRPVQDEENEHHANRHLQADPEGEARKEERVRERTRIYDEQGVGIAAHQQGAANDGNDTDEDALAEESGEDDVGDEEVSEDDEEEN